MSGTGFKKENQQELKREYQFAAMKHWSKGNITGRQCIEEIVALEKVLFLNADEIKEIKEKYEQADSDRDNPGY